MAKQDKPIIKIEDLSFGYHGEIVLKHANPTINEREFVALIGSNGSGKTTLAMILAGLLKPKKGTIRIGGVNLGKIKRLNEKIGSLFQNPDYQIFCDNVESEIEYGVKDNKSKMVKEILENMDLKKCRDKKLLDLILNFNSNGKTIILITHDMRIVAEYCRRVIVMNKGRIILDGGTRAALSKTETLNQAHLKPPP